MDYTKGEKINFHELDKHGNHLMRLVGGDQEHRANLMIASEDMYKALKQLKADFARLLGAWEYYSGKETVDKALARAEGK